MSEKCRIWISSIGLTPSLAPLTFCADRVVLFLSFLSAVPSSQVCRREEAQIQLLTHLTQSRDGALNFVLKIVEFL
jgi:hypothetical protein